MDKVLIPGSSIAISRLGLGCARMFGAAELRRSSKLLEAALKCGITHFDTAPSYGSEDVLGAVLGDTREATIATKVGIARATGNGSATKTVFGPLYRATLRPLLARAPALKSQLLRAAARQSPAVAPIAKRRLHRDEVLRELDDSLRRLRRKTIDLYLLHEPDGIEITDELREVFRSLQNDGLIRSYGLAFGAIPTGFDRFGTVVQCRYPGNDTWRRHRDVVPIYHGVVRFGLQQAALEGSRQTAGTLIARALDSQPGSAVIFSASTRRQVHEVSTECGQ